jgi:pilus assembly protein CpaC
LNFIPTITPRGTIQLQVAPEVSALDFTNGLTISGFVIPALTVRRVRTEVELNDGQSFAIGGLLDNRETETFSKVPYLGSIPIFGKLFQSITRTKSNTELIVIVTPELVAPIPVGAQVPDLKYPQNFLPSNSGIPMTTPGSDVTGLKPSPAAPSKIPVETLIESMKPEQPLIIESSTSTSGSYGGNTSQPTPTGSTTAPAPQ